MSEENNKPEMHVHRTMPRLSITYTKKMDYGKEGTSVTMTMDVPKYIPSREEISAMLMSMYDAVKGEVDREWEKEGLY